jgi:hypothetical protein
MDRPECPRRWMGGQPIAPRSPTISTWGPEEPPPPTRRFPRVVEWLLRDAPCDGRGLEQEDHSRPKGLEPSNF